MKRWINLLPWLAFVALVLLIALMVIGNPRAKLITRDPALSAQAQDTINKLQEVKPDDLSDPDFQSKLMETLKNGQAVTLWLIDNNGKLIFAEGSTATATRNFDPAQLPIQNLLNSLPPDSLSNEQKSLLINASWIQVEGEHNDIYDHKVAPLFTSNGTLLGTLGMAYEISSSTSQDELGWKMRLIAGIACFMVYWLSLVLWVWFDARQRGEKAWVWTCFVLIGNLAALTAYLLTRRPVITNPSI